MRVLHFYYEEEKRFRLDSDGPVPRGVAELEAFNLGVTLAWQPLPQLTVQGSVSAVLNQTLTIEDRAGREVVKEDLGESAQVGLSISYRF